MNDIDLKAIAKAIPREKQSFENVFLAIALSLTGRPDCTRRQYGSVVVTPDNIIVGTGYNAPPRGEDSAVERYMKDNLEVPCDFGCCKGINAPHGSSYDQCNAEHAESNALDLVGRNNHYEYLTLYIAGRDGNTGDLINTEPCIFCSRKIRNYNVKDIICLQADGTTSTLMPKYLKLTL